MHSKIKGERVPLRHGVWPRDVSEFRAYLKGDWGKTHLPRIVKRWDVNLDEDYESLEFTGPLLNLRLLHPALDKLEEFQGILQSGRTGTLKLLLRYKGVNGPYEKNSAGVIFPDYIEISSIVPAPLRKKVFSILPDFLVRTRTISR